VPNAPTLLVRTPYGRNGLLSRIIHQSFAERGFQRPEATSGGPTARREFSPFADDRATGWPPDWLEKQPWHNGKVVTFGRAIWGTYSCHRAGRR